jgi:hypothetical protein
MLEQSAPSHQLAVGGKIQIRAEIRLRLLCQDPKLHRDAGVFQFPDSGATVAGVRINNTYDDFANAPGNDGIGARGRPTVEGARLERNEQGCISQIALRGVECANLCMGRAGWLGMSASNDLPCYNHDTAHRWIG